MDPSASADSFKQVAEGWMANPDRLVGNSPT